MANTVLAGVLHGAVIPIIAGRSVEIVDAAQVRIAFIGGTGICVFAVDGISLTRSRIATVVCCAGVVVVAWPRVRNRKASPNWIAVILGALVAVVAFQWLSAARALMTLIVLGARVPVVAGARRLEMRATGSGEAIIMGAGIAIVAVHGRAVATKTILPTRLDSVADVSVITGGVFSTRFATVVLSIGLSVAVVVDVVEAEHAPRRPFQWHVGPAHMVAISCSLFAGIQGAFVSIIAVS
jgi:hypothetical protein